MSKKQEQKRLEREEHEAMQESLREQIARIDKLLEAGSLTEKERERLLDERENLGMDFVLAEILGP